MFSYENLDRIADSVNPLLGVFTLAWAWVMRKRSPYGGILGNIGTLVSVAAVYGIQWIDNRAHIWPAASLDYSTHTAVCTVLVVSLFSIDKRAGTAGIAIGLTYAALMRYQDYHSLADIITTAIALGLSSAGLWWLLSRFTRGRVVAPLNTAAD